MTKFRELDCHLSVGAILKDKQGNFILDNSNGLFAFMTGTVEDDEPLETCLHRELMEEFGMMCGILQFSGVSTVIVSDKTRSMFKKSIIWFECILTHEGFSNAECKDIVRVKSLPTENRDHGRWPFIPSLD